MTGSSTQWRVTYSPVPADFARIRRLGYAATESMRELVREVDGWASRPLDPAPVEVHEVGRSLATALERTSRIADALALQAERAQDDEGSARAAAAARALDAAVSALGALGRSMADRYGLEAWADEAPGAGE